MIIIQLDSNITSQGIWPCNNKGVFTKFEALIYILVHIEKSIGEYQITISGLAKQWSWSRHKVRDFLKTLVEEDKIIVQKKGSKILIDKMCKNIQKDIEKDTRKDSQNINNINAIGECKDTCEDMAKDVEKDIKEQKSKLPISKKSMLKILNM